MKTWRLTALCAVALSTILAAYPATARPHVALAADAPHAVWQIAKRTFDPATGQDVVAQTFTPQASAYLVEIALASSDPGDEVYAQLGTNDQDATQVQSGEDRFFVASNLKKGAMPAFRVIADPHHNYGGRKLVYAVQVVAVPSIPIGVNGTAVSTVPNVLAFSAPAAATYTLHYRFDTGSAHIIVLGGGGVKKDSGQVSGEGGFTVGLQAGLFAIGVKQQPGSGTMQWSLNIGMAPAARDFRPTNNAVLRNPPATLSAVAAPGAHLVLDHRTVGGSFDSSSGRLTYRPSTPLAPGLHLLEVAGADGTLSTASARFVVAPPAVVLPAASPAGSANGVAWERTSTPDGRYSLLKPTGWQMAESGGATLLVDPRGAGFVVLQERYLSASVDALSIAHKIGAALGAHVKLTAAWRYGGSKADAMATAATAATAKAPAQTVDVRVLPSAGQYSLLLAFGFGSRAANAAGVLARIEGSLAPNGDAALLAARRFLHYDNGTLALDYPAGWVANFTSTGGSWFLGPTDQAMLIAVGASYNGTGLDSNGAEALGKQLQGVIQKQVHPQLRIVQETASGGVYRWLAVYPLTNGSSIGVEVGEAVAANGHAVAMFGDTALAQAPANIPLLSRSLDSAARAAGARPPSTALSLGRVVSLLQAQTPAARSDGSAAKGGTPAQSQGKFLSAYQRYMNQQEYFQTMSNIMEMQHQTNMAIISNMCDSCGYSYDYEYTYNSY